jgi:2-hydroxycyclohexanecarboxyl-CoA dehydrogenase
MSFVGGRYIVTGAGRGIGWATAARLNEQGARVAVLARHPDSAEAAVARLPHPEAAFALAGDLADRTVNDRLMGEALERLGGVDGLVNNAGWTLTTPFLDESPAYWDEVLDINLRAVIWASRTVLRMMVAQGQGGAIVNVVSDAGRVGMQGEAVYAAAKGGVVALTKSLAQEMARHRIRVNAVAPGPTNTRVLEENMGVGPAAQDKIQRMIRRIPLQAVAEPEDVAAAVVFLLSSQARMITGQTLSVSGGLTMV